MSQDSISCLLALLKYLQSKRASLACPDIGKLGEMGSAMFLSDVVVCPTLSRGASVDFGPNNQLKLRVCTYRDIKLKFDRRCHSSA